MQGVLPLAAPRDLNIPVHVTNSKERVLAGPAKILMCPPRYYGVEYVINPWMKVSPGRSRLPAMRQWRRLVDWLRDRGAALHFVSPRRGLPDLVFTANAALVYKHTAVISRFKHPERQGEEPVFAQWFQDRGYHVVTVGAEDYFEGAGDALFCGDTLFAGYHIRSTAAVLNGIAERLNVRIVPLELVDPRFYHLDTCFCPIDSATAIWFPAAFDRYAQEAVRHAVPRLVEVSEDEAIRFACNAVVVGKSVITNTGCLNLHTALRSLGFEPFETPLDEFLAAGGSAKCLTLRLDGEESANWKQG